jgi:hypothetical protein
MNVPIEQRAIAIVFSLAFVMLTVQLIRKNKLREAYALGWFISFFIILILSIFSGIVDVVAGWFSITYTPTLVLVIGLLAALVILLLQSVILSTQADRIRDLAQYSALLELRLRALEEKQKPLLRPMNGQSNKRSPRNANREDGQDRAIIQESSYEEELSV